MSSTEPKNNEEAKKKGGKIVLIICIVIILALIGVVIYLLTNKDGEEQGRRNVVVNEDNVEEIIEQMQDSDRVADGYYEMTMNSTWYFENGTTPSENAYVENTVTNTNAVYFDIMRSDTEETIFESPIIPVGSHMEEITLDKDLDAGTYDCVLVYHLMDEEYENEISTVRVSVTIVIES